MDSPSFHPGGLREFGKRVRTYWPAKLVGTTVGMTVFFLLYFQVLQYPGSRPFVMPLTVFDRLIGFWPGALPLYLSLWLYVSLAPALLTDKRELLSYGVAALALATVGLTIFWLWPTAVPPAEVDWSRYPSFAFLKSVDASGNACPSLHVAFAVFSGVWFHRVLRRRTDGSYGLLINWLWCLGILYSTVAIRQHVVLDVVAGAVLGFGVAALHLYWLRATVAQDSSRTRLGLNR